MLRLPMIWTATAWHSMLCVNGQNLMLCAFVPLVPFFQGELEDFAVCIQFQLSDGADLDLVGVVVAVCLELFFPFAGPIVVWWCADRKDVLKMLICALENNTLKIGEKSS